LTGVFGEVFNCLREVFVTTLAVMWLLIFQVSLAANQRLLLINLFTLGGRNRSRHGRTGHPPQGLVMSVKCSLPRTWVQSVT